MPRAEPANGSARGLPGGRPAGPRGLLARARGGDTGGDPQLDRGLACPRWERVPPREGDRDTEVAPTLGEWSG